MPKSAAICTTGEVRESATPALKRPRECREYGQDVGEVAHVSEPLEQDREDLGRHCGAAASACRVSCGDISQTPFSGCREMKRRLLHEGVLTLQKIANHKAPQ